MSSTEQDHEEMPPLKKQKIDSDQQHDSSARDAHADTATPTITTETGPVAAEPEPAPTTNDTAASPNIQSTEDDQNNANSLIEQANRADEGKEETIQQQNGNAEDSTTVETAFKV
ncbi:unnamed protein product [Ambrosiozyma monospora]|uniref:Unnamed protein product n=1 Tax=Ambrosiozyma monospora TaxID=43982 RepID=A0ACB5TUZ8_AMBMO|nr:unnamed protein product [Ambrosiozyma monospora]